MAKAPPGQVLTTLLASEAAAGLPVPSFMSFGSYEAGGVLMWTALGIGAAEATRAVMAIHICSQVIDYGLGGLGLLLFTLFGGRRAEARRLAPVKRWLRFALAACALLVVSAVALWQYRSVKKLGSLTAPPAGHAVVASVAEWPPSKLLAGVKGFVVWSSNRSGQHDLYRLDLATGAVRPLTSDPHVDHFPRISPDGTRVAFCRSQVPWVSHRNPVPWDVYLLDLETGAERKISDFGTTPTWEDADRILFQRRGTQVVEHVLSTGQERVIFEAGRDGIPGGSNLETPSYSPERGILAVTLRGAARGTALVTAGQPLRPVGDGCQLAWSPRQDALYLVDHGGHMKNAVYQIDPVTLAKTLWFDAPGDFSHEYFPRPSADGRWLVYGASASAKEHEHDSADYEIFLWRTDTPMDQAVRLTWHTGNDNWPDIWVEGEGKSGP